MISLAMSQEINFPNEEPDSPAGLTVIRCQHGGVHGIVGMMAAAKLAAPLADLKSLNAILVGDSVGSFAAAGLATGKDPATFPSLFKRHVLKLLSPKVEVVLQELHDIFGDMRVCDVDVPLYITSANITAGVKPGGFLFLPQDFRIRNAGLNLPDNINETTLLKDALSASIAVPFGRLPRTLPDGQRHMDMGMIEQHSPILQIVTQFRRLNPHARTLLLSMNNFIIEPEVPEAGMDLLWAIRKGPRLFSSYVQTQRQLIDLVNYDHVIELGAKVPKGTALPSSLSAAPYDIEYITKLAEEIMRGDEYQSQIGLVETAFASIYGQKKKLEFNLSEAVHPTSLIALPEYQPQGLRNAVRLGKEFYARANAIRQQTGEVVMPAVKGLAAWLRHEWQQTQPARERAGQSLLNKLLPPRVHHDDPVTPPLLPRSSEQRMPSESGHMPL